MTDKEIKRLRRAELIEIIYEFQKNQDTLQTQVNTLRTLLSERRIKIRESGSIAEAALKVNEIFERAQAAADQYLDSVKALESAEWRDAIGTQDVPAKDPGQIVQEAQNQADFIVRDAQKLADSIIRRAKAQQSEIIAQTDAAVSAKWAKFKNAVELALRAAPGADDEAITDYLREMRFNDAE